MLGILVQLEIMLILHNSTCDVIVYVQMSHQATSNVLPPEDVALFDVYNKYRHNNSVVVLYYLTKPTHPVSFYQAQMEKFRILELVQYRRVLYMDADVMPVCGLDFLFHLSEKGILKENVIFSGDREPANGGLFMLRPGVGEYQQLMAIVKRRDAAVASSLVVAAAAGASKGHDSNQTFDPVVGWGHVIEPPDRWKTRYSLVSGTRWDFYAAFADQGLLYHWVKYVKMNTSILLRTKVEHWSSSTTYNNATTNNERVPILEATVFYPFKNYRDKQQKRIPFGKPSDFVGRHICHFSGPGRKPWNLQVPVDPTRRRFARYVYCFEVWHNMFDQVKLRLNMSMDIMNVTGHDQPLGSWSKEEDFPISLEQPK